MEYQHTPVMMREVMEYLDVRQGDTIVDCTLGGASYTIEIAKRVGQSGCVIAIDADKLAITNAKKILNTKYQILNTKIINDNFSNLKKIIQENGIDRVNGVVFDLGLSSAQLQDRTRGFSFQLDAPLNMNFGMQNAELRNNTNNKTEEIINEWRVEELEKIIREYGEERYAGRIAKTIIKNRPIARTKQLVDIIEQAVPGKYKRGRLHPATRTFQALRIATNNELDNLKKTLPPAVELLAPGGRLAVISYHSLEDRIIKNFFRQEARECICPPEVMQCVCRHEPSLKILTKKVVIPMPQEIQLNPRARSAKLRCAERL